VIELGLAMWVRLGGQLVAANALAGLLLIVPHLVLACVRFHGARFASALVVATATAGVVAGVAIHYLWGALGWIPPPGALGGTAPLPGTPGSGISCP